MLLDYYLPAIECLCSNATTHTEVQEKKQQWKNAPCFQSSIFTDFSLYLFLQQVILIKTLESGKSSYRIFWFHTEEMNKNCNHKCFPMEYLQELCSLLPLLQLHNPTERKSDEISGGSRWLKALNSLKSCQGYQKRDIWSPVAALPRKGNYCLKGAVDQFNIPQVNWNDTGVETLATTLWPISTDRSKETTQIVRTREISSWKRQGNYRSRMLLPLHLVFGNQVQRLQTRERHCGQVWMRTLERIMTGKQGVRFLSLYFAKVYLKISSPVLRCFHQR